MKNINSFIASLVIALILVLSMFGVGWNALSAGNASASTQTAQVTTAQALQDLAQR